MILIGVKGIQSEIVNGGRLEWIDTLRGIAILLVIVWHAGAVPALFGWPMPDWLRTVNNAFLPFRMPMLMTLSGLVLPRALAKTRVDYYLGKIRTLAWPYLLWAIIYLAQYGSSPPLSSWRAWYAVGYLWFLFFIGVYYFIAPLVTRLPNWLTPWLFMLASIPLPAGTEKRLLYFGTFFFLGYWLANSARLRDAIRGWPVAVSAAVGIGFGVASAIWSRQLAYRGEFALFSVAGVLATIWLAQRATGNWTRPLAFVGRNSIVYYVVHFPLITLVTVAVDAGSPPPRPWLWVLTLAVGVACGTAAAHARRWPAVEWLFVMPAPLINWTRPLLARIGSTVTKSGDRTTDPSTGSQKGG